MKLGRVLNLTRCYSHIFGPPSKPKAPVRMNSNRTCANSTLSNLRHALEFFNESLKTLVFVFLLTSCFSQKSMVMNRTVLKINDAEISTQEFAERLAQKLRGFDALAAKDESTLKRAKDQTVEAFIFDEIIRRYARTNNLSINSEELEKQTDQVRARYPDDNAFRRALADENIPLDRWQKDLESTLLQKKVVKHLAEKLPQPTDADLKLFYDKNSKVFDRPARIQLRQIVVERENDAKRIMDELVSGAKFEDIAKKFSVAPEAEQGGVTDWIEKGALEVFDAAFKLNIGTRSKVVKSPYGYHIYEVLKKEPEGRLSFEQAKAKIRAQIMERKEQEMFTAWLEEQVRKSTVFKDEALIKSIQVTTRGT